VGGVNIALFIVFIKSVSGIGIGIAIGGLAVIRKNAQKKQDSDG